MINNFIKPAADIQAGAENFLEGKKMTNFDLERINQISPSELETAGLIRKSPRGSRKDGHGYCCVYCSSGTGQNQSGGLDFDYRGDAWVHTCRSCGNGGDNIKFFQHVFNADFQDACRQASEMFGIPIAESNNFSGVTYRRPSAPLPKPAATTPPRLKLPEKTAPEQVPLIKDDIAQAQKTLPQLPEDQRRGLSLETLQYFHCGFAPRWVHPVCRLENKTVSPTPRIIIPTSDGEHYLALALDRDRKLDPKNSYHKPHAGAKTKVFNADDLKHETIIVVEGEVDAMSIFQAYTSTTDADVGVVATLSAGGWKNLIIAQIDNGLFEWHKFIILFDNDDAGHKTADEFKAELEKRGCPAVIKFLDDYVSLPFINNYISPETKEQLKNSKIDANAMLKICGRSNLAYALSKIFSDAEKEFGDIHNQRTLDLKPLPIEAFLTNAEQPAAVEQPADTNIFDEWQELNGKINPDVVPKIFEAHNYLGDIKVGNLTPDIVQSSKLKHALALCTFYDTFSADVSKFFATLGKVRKAAKENLQLVANDLATEDENSHAWEIFSVTTFKADIDKIKKQIAKAHKNFTRSENNRIATEDNHRRIQARAEQVKTNEDRLKELWTQPQSAERDAEIISLIRDSCVWKYDKNGNPIEIKSNGRNADLIFKYDPVIVGLFGKDYFRDNVSFLRKPSWRTIEQHTKTWNDDDDSQLRNYLRLTYDDFGNELLVTDNIVVTAAKNAFHEVKDYFKSLPKWDGVKRAETYFIDVLKVDDTPFVREVTLNWLTAAVARIYRPGCRYHYCLIIHGAQGIGKSFSFESLGKNWYQVLEAEVTDPHAIDALETTWIGEFAEFKGMRKADVNATKAFVSTSADNRRRAYAHHTVSVPRHCVLCATVNDNEFLSDATGNRRFPIFESRLKAYEHGKEITDEYIAQIWAEVYQRYMEQFHNLNDLKLGHALQLSTASQAIVEGTAEKFIRDDGLKLEIESFLDIPILPAAIWTLMSKEERRKFIAEKAIVFDDETLCRRRRGLGGRPADVDRDIDAIRKAELNQDFVVDFKTLDGNSGANYRRFFGYVKREHICAAEINSECPFKGDRRYTMRRIGEVLQQLDGWHDGGRYQNQDPEYKDQRKCYWRNSADTKSNTQNNNQDTDKNNTQEEVLQNENSTDTDKTVSHGIKLRNYDSVIIPDEKISLEPPIDDEPFDPDNMPF